MAMNKDDVDRIAAVVDEALKALMPKIDQMITVGIQEEIQKMVQSAVVSELETLIRTAVKNKIAVYLSIKV